jgi:uncharacterized protein DUF4332
MMDLKGIDPMLVARLRAAGVETTSDMVNVWLDRDGRGKFVTSSGLSEEQFQRMASVARVARMIGVGPKYAELLVTAGVIGRKSLSKHTPETLLKRLAEVKGLLSFAGAVPTSSEVTAWFAALKPEAPGA